MKTRLLAVVVCVLFWMPGSVQAGDLTLRDLVELHRAGLGDEVLVAVIEADGGPFTLSYADIMDLKSEGLNQRVIAALIRTKRPATELLYAPPTEIHQTQVVHVPVFQHASPDVVVVVPSTPYGHRRRIENRDRVDGHHEGRDDRHGGRRYSSEKPPATWITPGRPVHSGRPAATWVTPASPW